MSDAILRRVREPLFIEKVEAEIVARLKSELAGTIKVDAFPADPRNYDFANLKAAALVHYMGSAYRAAESPTRTDQQRRMQFAIILLSRSLLGENGAYGHLEDLRLALQGSAFAGAGPAEIVRDELEEEREGIWRWRLQVALTAPAVARERIRPAPLMRPVVHSQAS